MTLVLTALVLLAVGAGWALGCGRAPRLARAGGLVALGGAAVLCTAAAIGQLTSAGAVTANFAWPLPLGTFRLALDGLSAWFLLVIGAVSLPVAVYTWSYLTAEGEHAPGGGFVALLCVLTAALIVTVCAADVIPFLLGWEMMSVAAFFLILWHDHDPAARRGAWMYLIATHLGTAAGVVPLFAVLAARSGTTAFADFRGVVGAGEPIAVVLFVLALLGFGTKAGLMPMHVWLPAAHPVAPSPVSALLSGVVVKTGIYGLLRGLAWLPPLPAACGWTLFAIAAISGVLGVLYALAQHDLKRLLAYHTVENLGIIGLGIAVGMLGQSTGHPAVAALGYLGALLHVLNHALFKGLLFLSAGAVLQACGTGAIERLGGLARNTPLNAGLFLVGALAICGLPPLNGFVSEWLIYGGLFRGTMDLGGFRGLPLALGLVALVLMGGLALACFAKVFGVVFLGEPRDASVRPRPTGAGLLIGMAGLAVGCAVIGLAPGLFVPLMHAAVGTVTGTSSASVGTAAQTVLAPAGTLSGLALVFLLVLLGLALLRRAALRRSALRGADTAAAQPTWGCGYAYPTARMQYTAASFAGSLLQSFSSVLPMQRSESRPHGPFPARSEVSTHAVDFAEQDLFNPLFRGAQRLFAMIRTVSWTGRPVAATATDVVEHAVVRGPVRALLTNVVAGLRRGNIQVYLTLMVITLIVLFCVEAVSRPEPARPAVGGAVPAALREVAP